jgi:hypothetical protein
VIFSTGANPKAPATLTTISIEPYVSTVFSTIFRAVSKSDRSPKNAVASPPEARMAAAVVSASPVYFSISSLYHLSCSGVRRFSFSSSI